MASVRCGRGISRRGLASAGAACLLTYASSSRAGAEPRFFRRHGLPIGIQLHTFGPDAGRDLPGLLKRISAIGYRTAQASSYFGRTPAELRRALDDAGLTCPSLHLRLSANQDFDALAAEAEVIGARSIGLPIFSFPGGTTPRPAAGETVRDAIARVGRQFTADDWKRQAEFLNRSGEALRSRGLRLSYHNHNIEFSALPGGKGSGFDVLLAETDPSLVFFEIDVGWVAAAGLDPVALLQRCAGRIEMLHVKDIKPSTRPNYGLQQEPVEVGSGALDWRRVLPAAYQSGARQFYVEQEPPFERDRLLAAAISFEYLNGLRA